MNLRIPLFFLVLMQLATPAAHAQIVIDVPGRADVPLAVARTQSPASASAQAGEVWQTLQSDLQLAGYFQLLDPNAHLDRSANIAPGTFSIDSWVTLGASVLVKTAFLPQGDSRCDPQQRSVCLDLYVYHVASNSLLASHRLRTDTSGLRHLAHSAANHVVEAVTGRAGPFGYRLLAVSERGGNKEIAAVDLDGRGVSAITRNGTINLSPSLSPNNDEVAWTSFAKGNPDLFVKNLTSGTTRNVSSVLGVNVSPNWSPDGSTLALARSGAIDTDIVLIDARTGDLLRSVTRGGGIDVAPAFSPNGKLLAFASERSGGSQVYVMDLDSGDVRRVTFQGSFNGDPVFHPDGKQIAFVGRERGGFDIFVVNVDGTNLRRITQDMRDNEDPAWSPDGMYLTFSSTRTGSSELWVSTADGRHHTRVTSGGGWSQPTWVPRP